MNANCLICTPLKTLIVLNILFFIVIQTTIAQQSNQNTIQGLRINNNIKFDGILDDNVWQKAKHITNFTQRDLDYGNPLPKKPKSL